MKHPLCTLLFVFIALYTFAACESDGEVSNLLGQWQLTERTPHDTPPADCHTEGLFWNFQQHLVDIQSTLTTLNGVSNHTMGRFVFTGDSLHITELYVHTFDRDSLLADATIRTLVPAGIYGNSSRFAIETLTSNRMVLKSDSCRLVFRKYS